MSNMFKTSTKKTLPLHHCFFLFASLLFPYISCYLYSFSTLLSSCILISSTLSYSLSNLFFFFSVLFIPTSCHILFSSTLFFYSLLFFSAFSFCNNNNWFCNSNIFFWFFINCANTLIASYSFTSLINLSSFSLSNNSGFNMLAAIASDNLKKQYLQKVSSISAS